MLPFIRLDIPLIIAEYVIFGAVTILLEHIPLFEFAADSIDSISEGKIRIGWKLGEVSHDDRRIFFNILDHLGMA